MSARIMIIDGTVITVTARAFRLNTTDKMAGKVNFR